LLLIWLNKAVKLLSILINTLWIHRCTAFTKDLLVIKIRVSHLFSVLCSPIMCRCVIHRNWQRRSHKTKNKNQLKTSKKRTQCALDTTIRKQTQITLIRHESSYKQLEVKTNQPSFVCWNHNTESKTQRHIIGENKTLHVLLTLFVFACG
jgi:hypothetical protein